MGAVKSSLLPIYAVVKRPVGLLTTHFHKERLKIDGMNVAATIGPHTTHTEMHTYAQACWSHEYTCKNMPCRYVESWSGQN